MENLSHSLRHSKHSRRSSHANAAAKGVHDDVFGGPPKFGVPATLSPRTEDYREIFGRFHAPRVSSIPVLDLPVVDEHDAYLDFRSPGFDYSEVFGGFRGLDFADGYEELFGERRCGSAGSGSSDEAWTPTASESLSEESDHSGNNQCLSNGDSHHSLDGSIKHNISYHKANTRSDIEITNGLSRTAEIHAVPGYSYMVDHIDPYQVKEKQLKKTRSDNLNVRNDVRRQRDYGRVNSCPGETFMTISEVNLRTKPSHLPPPSRPPPAAAIGDTNGSVSSCKTGYLEGNPDNSSTSSQPFFDVEVDASSSAAAVASAAAMKEAMVKAQAQLRSAKEMMERKKEGRKNHARMGSSGDWRDMGGNCLNEDIVNGRSRGKGSQMKNLIMEDPRDVMGMKCVVQDSLEGEKLKNCLKQSAEKVQGEESEYSEMFGKLEEAGQWKEATQFFELVRVDRSGAVLSQRDKEKYLPENLRTCDSGEMEGTLGGFPGQENFNMIKATVGRRVPHEDSVVDAKNVNPKGAKEVSTEKDIEQKEKASQHIGKCEEAKKTHRKAHHDRETLVNLNGCASSEDHESPNVLIEVVHEFEVEQVMEHKRDGLKLKKSSRRPGAKENVTEGHEKACNEKRPREPSGREEKEGKPSIVIELMGNEKRHRELYMQEEEENKQTVNLESAWEEANEREENEWRLKETHELEENEKRMREDLEQEERKKLKDADEQDENDKRMKANVDLAENKRKQGAAARDEKRLREANKQAEKVKLKEALEEEENEKKLVGPLEQEEREQRKKEALEKEEMEKMLKEAFEREESEKRLNEACEKEQTKKRLEEAQEMEENERRLRETHTRECCQDEYDDNNLKDSHMDERISTRDERDDDMEEDDAAKDTFELEELDKWLQEVVYVEEPDYLNDADKKVEACMQHDTKNAPDFPASGFEQVGESSDAIDTSNDDGDQILAEDSIKSPPLFDRPEQTNRETPKVFSQMSNGSRQQDEKNSAQEWGETKENINKTEACFDEDGKMVETPQPAVLNTQRISRQLQNASQAEGRKENLNGSVEAQERESERLRREQEVEKDRLRKIEEEKEREREREKDRMGIDRATLEAKERAYAEVREKAERASVERAIAEARQRSLAEARERLEKACAEAREQSFLEKMSMEARIKAERAAMERATAEARERAASKYNGMRQSNLTFDLRESQHQTAGSSSSTKHQNSSEYGTPHNVQKSEGVEGESAQRCKARLERHRRTAERAAKALAEKNMRDLLAQKEQAERSRLAETLDADVKRWSSGKEGNLRALLSTLQYILGPDSGWQPVPLTEVITSAAVKKAYRKATLCVHPDKLQQRGASIQQKYICEKVFDLLKEAWNRFNSEER